MPFPAPGDLPDPEIEPEPLASSALAGGFFTTGTTWEAPGQEWRQKKTKVQEREFVHILLINSLKYTVISILYRLFKHLQHLDLPELKSNDFYLSF